MNIHINLGTLSNRVTAFVITALLALSAAVESALAISPTADAPVKWAGGWEATVLVSSSNELVIVVPAGKNLLVTDVIATNLGPSFTYFHMWTGSAGGCSNLPKTRLNTIAAPPQNVVHLPLETGIGFAAGQSVCIGTPATLVFNLRGFLFTPGP